MKTSAKIFLAGMFGMAALAPRSAEAAVPSSISHVTPGCVSYQGMLRDVQQGPVSLTVKLYTQLEGGTPIWAAKYNTSVQAGFFSVLLGANDGQTVSGSTYGPTELWKALWPDGATSTPKQVYVGVTVNDGSEVMPRQLLAVAPYAFTAQVAQEALKGASGFAVSGAMSASGNLTHTGTTASLAGGKVSANSTTVNLGTTSTTSKLQGNTVTITSGTGGTTLNSSGKTTIGSNLEVKGSATIDYTIFAKNSIDVGYNVYANKFDTKGQIVFDESGSVNRLQVDNMTGSGQNLVHAISEVVFSVTISANCYGKLFYLPGTSRSSSDLYKLEKWAYFPLAAWVKNPNGDHSFGTYKANVHRDTLGGVSNGAFFVTLNKTHTAAVTVYIHMLKVARSIATNAGTSALSLD